MTPHVELLSILCYSSSMRFKPSVKIHGCVHSAVGGKGGAVGAKVGQKQESNGRERPGARTAVEEMVKV